MAQWSLRRRLIRAALIATLHASPLHGTTEKEINMPKFKVCVQRYVEETASVIVEAETPEQAMQQGDLLLHRGDIESWTEG